MKRYKSEIVVPLTLSINVLDIQFNEEVLVQLNCPICKKSGRTVVLFKEQSDSYCIPTRHTFNGCITDIVVTDRESEKLLTSKFVVTATYHIKYDFSEFIEERYPRRVIEPSPKFPWSRARFELTCKCGLKTDIETQNNQERPWQGKCKCGNELYYEVDEIPIIQNTMQVKQD